MASKNSTFRKFDSTFYNRCKLCIKLYKITSFIIVQMITKRSIEMHFNITSRNSSIYAQVLMYVGTGKEDMCKYKDNSKIQ